MAEKKIDYYFGDLPKPYTIDWNVVTRDQRRDLEMLMNEYGKPSKTEPHVDVAGKVLPGIQRAFMGDEDFYKAEEARGGPLDYPTSFVSPDQAKTATSLAGQAGMDIVGDRSARGLMTGLLGATPAGRGTRLALTGASILGSMAGSGLGQKGAQKAQEQMGLEPDEQTPFNAAMWGGAGTGAGTLATKWGGDLMNGLIRQGIEPEVAMRRMIRLDDIEVDPTVLQVVDPGMFRTTIEMLHRIPTSQSQIASSIRKTNGQLSDAIDARTRVFVDGGFRHPEYRHAGREIDENVHYMSDGFRQRNKENYNSFNSMLPKDFKIDVSSPQSSFRMFLEGAAKRGEAPLVNIFSNKKASKVYKELMKHYVDIVKHPLGVGIQIPKNMPFDDVKRLRTEIGEMITDRSLRKKFKKTDLMGMYKALSDDIRTAIKSGTPERKAFDLAESEFLEGAKSIKTTLDRVAKKVTPEDAFFAAEQFLKKGNITHMRNIKDAFVKDPVGWDVVRRTWLHDMIKLGGGSAEGVQAKNFFDAWESLTPDAKRIIGETPGFSKSANDEVLKNINDIAKIAKNHWSPEGMANPLMTRSEIRNIGGRSGAAAASLFGAGTVGAASFGAYRGSKEDDQSSAFGSIILLAMALKGPKFIAKKMFDPKFTKWVVQGNKVAPGGVGAHIGKLAALYGNSEEGAEISSFLDVMGFINNEAALESGDPIQKLMAEGGGLDALGQ